MIYDEPNNIKHKDMVELFRHLVGVYSNGELAATTDGISDGTDAALSDVYEAATTGGDVQSAVDAAWVAFYNEFPSGS